MGLLLLGEKRTQDAHSEWPSSCKLKRYPTLVICVLLIDEIITISDQVSKVGKTWMSTVKCLVYYQQREA